VSLPGDPIGIDDHHIVVRLPGRALVPATYALTIATTSIDSATTGDAEAPGQDPDASTWCPHGDQGLTCQCTLTL
jgi:hypothetical protein